MSFYSSGKESITSKKLKLPSLSNDGGLEYVDGNNLRVKTGDDRITIDEEGITVSHQIEKRIIYKFRYISSGRLLNGTRFSIADGAGNSVRSYPIIRTGTITRIAILGTQATSTTQARVSISVQLFLNGVVQSSRYFNENGQNFVTSYNLNIGVREGDTLGLRIFPTRNSKGFTVIVEQEYL